jgi:Ca2+-binding EF-hand superfamily protein
MFRTFQKYDRNQNGFLDFGEYMQVLEESGLDLSRQEIVTTALDADVNGDQLIDFEEFVKHFTKILDMMSFTEKLHIAFCKLNNLVYEPSSSGRS